MAVMTKDLVEGEEMIIWYGLGILPLAAMVVNNESAMVIILL